jgi:hypothetical protein
MSFILPILFLILFIILGLVALGLALISRLVGGLRNLRSLFRMFIGRQAQGAQRSSAKSSSSGRSSHASYKKENSSDKKNAQTTEKMFGQNEGTYVEFEEVK